MLQKSFWGDDQNFSGPLIPFALGDMRDHSVSHKNDHGASYGRYAVLQRWGRLKISFCEIFGVVQFSTFATQSEVERTRADPAARSAADPKQTLAQSGSLGFGSLEATMWARAIAKTSLMKP